MNDSTTARSSRAVIFAGLVFACLCAALGLASDARAIVGIDTSFGVNGTVYSLALRTVEASALDADDRILVAGTASGVPGGFTLARFRADGSADPSFGSGGVVADAMPGPDVAGYTGARVADLAVQTDHRVVVVGEYRLGSDASLVAAVRLNEDGTPDASFGDGGRVLIPVQDKAFAAGVQIAANGDIVIGGESFGHDGGSVIAVRLDSNGDPVNSFGGDGLAGTGAVSSMLNVSDVLLDGDGVIVVAGSWDPASRLDQMMLARFGSNGELDTSYGEGGIAWSAFPEGGGPSRATRTADGRVLVAGGTGHEFAIARFAPSGHLDSTFASGGMVTAGLNGMSYASDVVTRPNGKVIAVGTAGPGPTAVGLLGTTSDGSGDPSFGNAGRFVFQLPLTSHSEGKGGMIDSHGRLVVVGPTGYDALGMARFLVNDTIPVVSLRVDVPRSARSSRLKVISGDVDNAPSVQLAFRRNIAKYRQVRTPTSVFLCRWMRSLGSFTKVKRGSACEHRRWLGAHVTSYGHWTFRLRKRLPRGRYTIYVRALDSSGVQKATLRKSLRVK